MTKSELREFWSDVHAMFGLDSETKSKQAAFEFTYSDVEQVPAEALKIAKDRIRELENLPRNLSKQIRQAWQEWKSRNPNRIRPEDERKGCPYCVGGYIFAEIVPPGYPFEKPCSYGFRCGHCYTGGGVAPVATREWLERQGYDITRPREVKIAQNENEAA